MKSLNTFVVNVSGLVDRPGSTRQVTLSGRVEPSLDQVEQCGPVTADLRAIGPEGDIDLSGVLHDELCLSVPLVPLCSESCRGLCPVCGVNLNEGSCQGHSESRESPFATLEALLEVPLETA